MIDLILGGGGNHVLPSTSMMHAVAISGLMVRLATNDAADMLTVKHSRSNSSTPSEMTGIEMHCVISEDVIWSVPLWAMKSPGAVLGRDKY